MNNIKSIQILLNDMRQKSYNTLQEFLNVVKTILFLILTRKSVLIQ